jgi:ATP-dependent Clp protease, protease subunit
MPADRSLTFFGSIRAPASTSLRTALCQMVNEDAKRVTILFASDGGSTDDGIALHAYLAALPLEITMHAVGVVGSMAIPVFLAAPKRLASKHARFFFHEYSWTHSQATVASQTTMTEQSMQLSDAVVWSQEVIKATTKLMDSDFERMKLFDHPVIIGPADAAKYGLVSSIEEPSISAANQPRIVV